jgi:hypothetical protein
MSTDPSLRPRWHRAPGAAGCRMTMATSIIVRVPLTIRRRPGRKTVVTPARDGAEAALPTRADSTLVKALARTFRYQRLLDEGRYASISEMAAAERLERGYLGSLLRLTLLAPYIVQAILVGQQPERITLPALMDRSADSSHSELWRGREGCAANMRDQHAPRLRPGWKFTLRSRSPFRATSAMTRLIMFDLAFS